MVCKERRGCEAPAKEDREAVEESFNEMNAIARGVEMKYDLIFGRSQIVSQRTIDVARQFGIPEKEIQNWATARAASDIEKTKAIKALLSKLDESSLA